MRKKIVKKQNEIKFPIQSILGFIIPCFIGLITTIVFSLIFSAILSKSSEISNIYILYFVISIVLGGLFCGFISSKILNFKGLFSGLISSVPLSLFIYVTMLFFSNGKLSSYSFIVLPLILLSSTVGGIISANTKRRK